MKPVLRRVRAIALVVAMMAALGGVAWASTTAGLAGADPSHAQVRGGADEAAQSWAAPLPAAGARPAALGPAPARTATALSTGPDWLDELNSFRVAAGVDPVTVDTGLASGLTAHLNYLNHTDLDGQPDPYKSPHTENPASPYYSPAGAAAGASSNLTLRVWPESPVQSIDTWLAAPFHAVGLLRPDLTKVAYVAAPPWYGIDVLDGLVEYGAPATPVLSPGQDVMTTVTQWFGGVENPNPLTTCGWQGFQFGLGAPIVALLPDAPVTGLTATLVGAGQSFSTAAGNLCLVDEHTYQGTADGLAALQGPDHPVFLLPSSPLSFGRYTVTISAPSAPDLSWSFVAVPPTKPGNNVAVTLHVTDSGAQTVIGNLTVTEPIAAGYATAYPCQAGLPNASNANYTAGLTIPNQVVVHPDANGDICLFTHLGAHLIWDQVAETSAFTAQAPVRLIDTRYTGKLPTNGTLHLHVADPGTLTVIGNLTVTEPAGPGYTTVYPCTAPIPTASNNNYVAGQTIPNLVVAHPDENGDICIYSHQSSYLIWDQVAATNVFESHVPVRLVDTRPTGRIPSNGFLKISGVAAPGQTVMGNLTVTDPAAAGFTTVYPCTSPLPNASNNNYVAGQTIPNMVTATADENGDICVFTSQTANLIWDQVVETSAFDTHLARRLVDTRFPQSHLLAFP